ncbi:CHAT domain-containing protein, partial [Mycena galopus ATCC 62051]
GDLDDLNNSISKHNIAIELTPNGHPNQPVWLNDLGNTLQLRFQRLGDLEDLTESLSKHRNAVLLTPCGHPSKPERFNNLGNALQLYFERLGDHCVLDDCISNHKVAVCLTPNDHPSRPIMLHNLGTSLQSRFERFGDLNDLNDAILRQKDTVKLIPDGHPDRFRSLNNLGHCLQIRFEELEDLNDLTESISKHKYAVHLTQDGHFDQPETLNNLGNARFLRFKQFNNPDDIWETIRRYTSAACLTTGPAHKRVHAASKWAQHAQTIQHHSLLDAYQMTIDLLLQLAWLGLSITNRHSLIMKAAPVVREEAVAAISSAELAKAAEWLEQGRSVIWPSPKLADDLICLSAQLEGATTRRFDQVLPGSRAQQSLTLIVQRAHENAYKRELLLKRIRDLEGFHKCLLPKSISELSTAAERGSAIFLNASQLSCDALILLPGPSDRVLHVPLPEFTPKDLKTLTQTQTHLMLYKGRSDADRLYGNREKESRDMEGDFAHILSELWVHLVKPVLNAIAITTPAKENLRRVWWCPTGPLASLPIHAAGIYGKGDSFGSKLSDYGIFSYTPSLAALIQGFRPFCQLPERHQLIAVAQPSAVGQPYIPGTKSEINPIQQCAPSEIPVCSLVAHEATIVRVEDEIMKSNWIHFASHGVQDPVTTTESALLLAGNSQLGLNLPHADFAFLSACQTATGEEKLQEESVHLAAGMLLAGYRGVITTVRSIMDNDAPEVAEDVYKHLFKSSPPDSTRAAEALHLAGRNLCQCSDGKKSFFRWVPFIHVGV